MAEIDHHGSMDGHHVHLNDNFDAWLGDGDIEDDDGGPADCPGGGIDDLCSWPDIESCGLCTLGMNPDLLPKADRG